MKDVWSGHVKLAEKIQNELGISRFICEIRQTVMDRHKRGFHLVILICQLYFKLAESLRRLFADKSVFGPGQPNMFSYVANFGSRFITLKLTGFCKLTAVGLLFKPNLKSALFVTPSALTAICRLCSLVL